MNRVALAYRLVRSFGICNYGGHSLAWIDDKGKLHELRGKMHGVFADEFIRERQGLHRLHGEPGSYHGPTVAEMMDASEQLLKEGWLRVVHTHLYEGSTRTSRAAWNAAAQLVADCTVKNLGSAHWDPERESVGVEVPLGNLKWYSPADFVRKYGGMRAENEMFSRILQAQPARAAAALGDCYEAAGKYIMDQSMWGGKKGLILVHGEVTGQGQIEGLKYGHAWVEDGGTVIDKSNGRDIRMPKVAYYALGRIGDNVHRYTWPEARKMIMLYQHWGPWDLVTESGL